jgi:uncharacterized protein (DUF934 family)
MPQLIRQRALAANEWVQAGTDAAAGASKLILPLQDYLKARAAGEPAADRAVLLQPEEQDLTPLESWLASLPLIAVQFGTTGDGRGYTQARLLRERFGYRGELRAVGQIRIDQIFFLARCGFNAFELLDGEDPQAAVAQLERFSVAYQGGVNGLTRPRRRYGG